MMRKLLLACILFASCSELPQDQAMPFYELIYRTTVGVHRSEISLRAKLDAILSLHNGDSVIANVDELKSIADSNQALIARIEESIAILSNAPDDADYREVKNAALTILKEQLVYHANSEQFVIVAAGDGVISQKERIQLPAYEYSYTALLTAYSRWQQVRDNYISGLNLTGEKMAGVKAQYGADQ